MASPAESPVSVADNGGFVAAVASTLPHSAVCDDAKTADAFVPASGLTVEIADAINHEVPATSEHISTSLSQEQSSLAQQHPQTPRPWAGAAAAAVAEAAAALAAHEAARTESRASALKELMEGRVTDRLQKFLEQKSGKSPSMGALSSPASAAMPVIGFAGSGGVDLRFAPRTLAGTAAGGSGADSNDADGSPQASPRVSFFDSESLPRSAPAIPPMPFSSSFSAPSLFSPSGRDRGTALKLISFADLSASKARADSAGIQAEPDAADRSSLSAAEDSVIAAALIRANSRPTLVVSASHSSSPVLSPDDTGFLRLPTPQLQYPPALQRKLSAATSPAPLVLSPWSSSKSDIAAPTASLTLTLPSTPNRAANAATAVEAYTLAQVLRTIPAPARFVQSEV